MISAGIAIVLVIGLVAIRVRGPHWLSATSSVTWARTLLVLGVDPDQSIPGYGAPLARHAGNGDDEIVRLLLDAGARVDSRDKYGWTPLFTAVHGGHRRTVEILIDHGADVDAVGDCRTAYQLARQYHHDDIAGLLAARGARTDQVRCD